MRDYLDGSASDSVERPEVVWNHDEETVFGVCDALEAFGVLPDAGGWLDQFEDWHEDIRTWRRLRSLAQKELDAEKEQEKTVRGLIGSDVPRRRLFGES